MSLIGRIPERWLQVESGKSVPVLANPNYENGLRVAYVDYAHNRATELHRGVVGAIGPRRDRGVSLEFAETPPVSIA